MFKNNLYHISPVSKQRNQYTSEFREEVVAYIIKNNACVSHVAAGLKISKNTVNTWMRTHRMKHAIAPVKTQNKTIKNKLRQIQLEISELLNII